MRAVGQGSRVHLSHFLALFLPGRLRIVIVIVRFLVSRPFFIYISLDFFPLCVVVNSRQGERRRASSASDSDGSGRVRGKVCFFVKFIVWPRWTETLS